MSFGRFYPGGYKDGSSGGTPITADSLNHMEQGILDGCAVTVTLPASGWSGSAPYTQTVSVDGMTADWVPGAPVLSLGGAVEVEAILAATEALGCIKMITSAAGTLTFTAPEDKPGAALTLRVPAMVERS